MGQVPRRKYGKKRGSVRTRLCSKRCNVFYSLPIGKQRRRGYGRSISQQLRPPRLLRTDSRQNQVRCGLLQVTSAVVSLTPLTSSTKNTTHQRRITTTRRKPPKSSPYSLGVLRRRRVALSVTARGAQAALACALSRLIGSSTRMDTSSQHARRVVGRTAQGADVFAQRARF
jgi:hypothetical protein